MNFGSMILKFRPPKIAMTLLLVFFGLHIIVKDPPLPEYWRYIGILVFCDGFGLMMWAWSIFRKKQNPTRPTEQPVVFITEGPYRFSRNPMYAGVTLMLSGIALAMSSLLVLCAPAVFFILINQFFIPFEERRLSETFGADYETYKKSVRRWV